ncbi:MAG TPA: hypothetical protein VIE65_04105 [Methylobacter sp.]|jgi:hypothetical protein
MNKSAVAYRLDQLPGGKLAVLIFTAQDAYKVRESLMRRIRRLMHLEKPDQEVFLESMRASRMCYELLQDNSDNKPRLTSLDREDIDVLYDLHEVEHILLEVLNRIRFQVRQGIKECPIAADRIVKGISDMFAE